MKIRSGFVSNSSSSSFIVIRDSNGGDRMDELKNKYKDTVLIVDNNFGNINFGWEDEVYRDFGSKLIFAFLQSSYLIDNFNNITDSLIVSENCKCGKMWMGMIEDVVKENLGVSNIKWELSIHYNDVNGKPHAYIDHQSASYEGKNTSIFKNKDLLKSFLFNEYSYIETGNDNGEY